MIYNPDLTEWKGAAGPRVLTLQKMRNETSTNIQNQYVLKNWRKKKKLTILQRAVTLLSPSASTGVGGRARTEVAFLTSLSSLFLSAVEVLLPHHTRP